MKVAKSAYKGKHCLPEFVPSEERRIPWIDLLGGLLVLGMLALVPLEYRVF